MIERGPWGRTAQSAVRWAYALLASADNTPSVLGDLRTASKPKRELTLNELRAQGAQIRGMVERMDDPVSKAYLIAFYLPHPMEERQQGGGIEFVDRFAELRNGPEQDLAWWLLTQQATGLHRIRGYREIVAQYCLGDNMVDRMRKLSGQDFGLERLRRLMKMDMNKVAAKRKECIDMLKDIDRRAHAIIDERLTSAGLI